MAGTNIRLLPTITRHMNSSKKKHKLDNISIATLIGAGLVLLLSFFAPLIFVQESSFGKHFVGTGEIGDTVGGLMNPFVALAGVFLTFLAFYIQFKANNQQREIFRQELDFNKFENQFYEMLKLHKDNVSEIQVDELKLYIKKNSGGGQEIECSDKTINGRRTFNFLKHEFELIYQIAKKHFPNSDPKVWVNEAYGVFFSGLSDFELQKHAFFQEVNEVKTKHKENKFTSLPKTIQDIVDSNLITKDNLKFDLFEGHSSQLAHYYRHLFQTVKFVVNQDEKMLSYNEKRKYLRILRAQLSNQEQAMLFYNWLSNFGNPWNNEKNKFFTDYRMIHNIYQTLIVDEVKLDELFELDRDYLKEENREFDPLFEFQDWNK